MSDPFVESLKRNEETLKSLSNDSIVLLALSSIVFEMSVGTDIPIGTKSKCISLSAELAKRAGVRW